MLSIHQDVAPLSWGWTKVCRWLVRAALSCSLLLSGCGGNTDAPKPKGSTKRTIGVSVMNSTNPFFIEISNTIKAEAAKHGYDVIATDGGDDVAKQQKQVKEFLVANCAAIVLCPCNSKDIAQAIIEANTAGVPVFTADLACDSDTAKVVSHVATDNYGGGKLAGKAMIEALGEAGGKVLVLNLQRAQSCVERVQGFKEILDAHNETHPNSKITVVAELPCEGDRDKGKKSTADALQTHGDLAGIFAINDPAALGARAAVESAGKADQIKIIGFDGQSDGIDAIKEGKIYADPIQFPDRIAKMTVDAIVRYFNGEKVEPVQLIPTALYTKNGLREEPK